MDRISQAQAVENQCNGIEHVSAVNVEMALPSEQIPETFQFLRCLMKKS